MPSPTTTPYEPDVPASWDADVAALAVCAASGTCGDTLDSVASTVAVRYCGDTAPSVFVRVYEDGSLSCVGADGTQWAPILPLPNTAAMPDSGVSLLLLGALLIAYALRRLPVRA